MVMEDTFIMDGTVVLMVRTHMDMVDTGRDIIRN